MKIVRIFAGQVYQIGDVLNLTQDVSDFTWLLFDGVYYGYAFTQILLQYQSNYCIRVMNLKDNCQDVVESSTTIIRNYVSYLEMSIYRDTTTKFRINTLSHLMLNKENTQFPILQGDIEYPLAEDGTIRFYIRGIYGITL